MAQTLDGIIDRNQGYTTKSLAKVLGYRETRSLKRDLERLGVWGTRLGRQTIFVGEAILLALANAAEAPPAGGEQRNEED